jgi:membrane dipeptidase
MISRRNLLERALLSAALTAVPWKASSSSLGLMRRSIVIDGQGSIADPYSDESATTFSARALAEHKASGMTACSMTLAIVGNEPDNFQKSIEGMAEFDKAIAHNPQDFIKVLSAADILSAKRDGKIGIIFNTQDTALVGTELDRLGVLKGRGIRVVQLTYNTRNLSGDGCLESSNAGLSRLGHATIERIEHEKLLLDLSHGGERTTAEALAVASRPPTISHTGCRALNDNPRNQWDAELRACANKGGVVGVYWMPFLVANGKPTGSDLVRHMEHVRQICGEDHVGIGTDGVVPKTVIDDKAKDDQKKFYEDRAKRGIAAPGEGPDIFNIVAEWDDPGRFEHLADGLSRAGWRSAAIEKALGANVLRLYQETWGT